MSTMTPFQAWWHIEGSGMDPIAGEDAEAHVKRVCEIAWSNGAYIARLDTEKAESQVSQLKAALELGQENCDAVYEDLRAERDSAREVSSQLTAELNTVAKDARALALSNLDALADSRRIDAIQERRWGIWYNDRVQRFIVQAHQQTCGTIAASGSVRVAIDDAMKAKP